MYTDKIKRKSNPATIVELFMMFLLLLVVIVVITVVCMTTREQSLDAGELTEAVICAENTAEVTKYQTDAAEAAGMLEQMEGVTDVEVSGENTVTARQDGYLIEVTLAPEEGSSGTYVDETITIYDASAADAAKGNASAAGSLYELHTGSYISKEGER